jgi:hypothetical protein
MFSYFVAASSPMGDARRGSPRMSNSLSFRPSYSPAITANRRPPAARPYPACDRKVKGSLAMTETKDISRRRLADFLAARLRAKLVEQNKAPGPSAESISASKPRQDERAAPVIENHRRLFLTRPPATRASNHPDFGQLRPREQCRAGFFVAITATRPRPIRLWSVTGM